MDINNILQGLHKNRIFTAIITMIGWLGTIDIYNQLTQDNHVALLSLKWFTISFFFALFLTLLISVPNKIIKAIGILVTTLYGLLSILNVLAFLSGGFGISCRLFTILMETNDRESNEFLNYISSNFLTAHFLGQFAIFLGITLLLAGIAYLLRKKTYITLTAILGIVGFIFTTIQMQDPVEKKNVNIILRACLDYSRTIKSFHDTEENRLLGQNEEQLLASIKGEGNVDNLVLIIGESASRSHHSIYGYDLNTTPKLAAIKDEILVFNDVIAPYSTTSESMKMFLTFKNYSTHTQEWHEYPSLPSIFRKLGYQTYWLSNQEKSGFFGGCEDYFSNKCDSSAFVGMLYSGDNLQEKYDEALLPELSKVMNHVGKKLIVLHMMGSHGEYYRRYPKEFARFTEKNILKKGRDYLNSAKMKVIAEYDNSILYSDYIVSNIIDTLKKYNNQKNMMLYFSDHAEEVYEKRDFSGHSIGFVEIPFIIWTNDSMRTELGDKYNAMAQSIDKPIATEHLLDFLLDVSGIQCEFSDSTLNFISPNYHIEKRIADDQLYQKSVD